MKNKERLLRSKSETNLKSPSPAVKTEDAVDASLNESSQATQSQNGSFLMVDGSWLHDKDLTTSGRPKSWSPDNNCDLFNSNLNGNFTRTLFNY